MLLSHVFSESRATMNLVPLGKVLPVLLSKVFPVLPG